MYYFAYGSNLNKAQMAVRCPKARPVSKLILPSARLVFRGVADVEYHETESVPGGVWFISAECEAALDRYEGVKSGLYRKEYFDIAVTLDGATTEQRALIYLMNSGGYYPPNERYLATIRKGYRDFGLNVKALNKAVKESGLLLSA